MALNHLTLELNCKTRSSLQSFRFTDVLQASEADGYVMATAVENAASSRPSAQNTNSKPTAPSSPQK